MRFRNSYQRIPSSLDGDADDETQHGTNWLLRIVLICSIVSIVALVAFGLAYLWFQPSSSTEKLFSQTSFSNNSISNSLTETNSTNSTTNQFKSSNCSSMTCCESGSCDRFSSSLFKHMDLAADPCNDFHRYVCGKKKFEIGTIINEIVGTLKEIGSVLKSESSSSSMGTKSKAVQYVMDLAKEHDDEDAREQLGAEPIRTLLSQVLGNERWPLLRENTNSSAASNLTTEIEATFAQFWMSWKLWEESTKDLDEPDDQLANVHQWMDCHVEASIVGVHSLINDFLTLDSKWKSQVNHIVLSQNYVNESDYAQLFSDYREHKKAISLLFPIKQWNSSLDSALFEVMHFNRELSRILKADSYIDYNDFTLNNSKAITLAELKLHSSASFDWTLLLNKLAISAAAFLAGAGSFRYTDDDTVHVTIGQLGEFKPFTKLIARTPIRVLKNRIAFEVIRNRNIRDLLDKKHRIGEEEKKEKTFLDIMNNLGNYAIDLVFPGVRFISSTLEFDTFAPVYARLHLDIVGRERMRSTRQQVAQLVERVKQSFRHSLKQEHNWLDEQTRQNALNKLDGMETLIGFPDWIFDDDALDEACGFTLNGTGNIDSQQIIKGHYAASFLNLIRLNRASDLKQFYHQNQRHTNGYFPFIFNNGAYLPPANSFVTSYTFLSEPLYHEDYPLAINFANIGNIAAHEITHGFDDVGRLYDSVGRKRDWWTNSTVQHFEHLSKCFVDKYDGLVESVTGVKIDGTTKLGENIADIGGLRHAYRAFEASLQHSDNCGQKLCDRNFLGFVSKKFTPEQLFFITYSTNYCSIRRNSTELVDETRNDPHSPQRFRINVPLANMDQFARAFNCPVGSKMNPQDKKCSLW